MRQFVILWMALLLPFALLADLHPMHVSVCEIEYDKHTKSLEISQQIFIDDLERTLQNSLGKNNLDLMEPGEELSTDELVENYIAEHVSFKVNGKEKDYVFIGYEAVGEVLRFYLEIENIRRLKSLEVTNTVLLDEFDDQTNLVHLTYNGDVNSLRLRPNEGTDIFRVSE